MGFTGPPLFPYLPWKTFVICGLKREGRLLPVGGRLIPRTPRCYGLWHTYMQKSMPGLSYIQMGQSVIVVTPVPGEKRNSCCSFIRRFNKTGTISCKKKADLISSGLINASNVCLFLVVESILDQTVHQRLEKSVFSVVNHRRPEAVRYTPP